MLQMSICISEDVIPCNIYNNFATLKVLFQSSQALPFYTNTCCFYSDKGIAKSDLRCDAPALIRLASASS